MHRRFFSRAFVGLLALFIINYSCTKLDTTTLGGDLLPVVDNINTFADTMFVNATQSDFTDSTLLFKGDNHVLGNITNDPAFGKTEASIFFQLKPSAFPFAFANKDSLIGTGVGFDSVVLCLSYQGSYGDTNVLQRLEVYEINDNQFRDSAYTTDYQPTVGSMIASKDVDITKLDDLMYYRYIKDSTRFQIRIKLSPSAFADQIYAGDSVALSQPGNHLFYNDSSYRKEFKGLAIKPVSGAGNALMYISVSDTNTKMEVHYRAKNGTGKIDTTYKSFRLRPIPIPQQANVDSVAISASTNYILRNRAGTPSANPGVDEIYLQTQPGTFANLSIPGLTGYSNRIIHRAELIVEQIPGDAFIDSIFPAPNFLYLDLKDTGTLNRYKPIYIDLNPNVFYDPDNSANFYPGIFGSGPDFSYYGGFARRKTGPFGGSIVHYNINISRYVQQMVKLQRPNYSMRLYPAFKIHYGQYAPTYYPYNNVAFGRVKVGSGTNPNYRMRVRIIYSPIK